MLAVKEGIFAGMSSGAAMYAALKKSSELNEGVVVVILPDRGDRYLSTALFTSVCGKCPP
jgi:cysteine synthase B